MHIRGHLLGNLGLREPHRLRDLQCRGCGAQLLQPGNPINPKGIRHRAVVCDRGGEIIQDLIEARHHGIRRWRLNRLMIPEFRHATNATDTH
jgi:hypothetical protein